MVKIRFRRTGSKKNPHYRVVVAESSSPRDGRFIEILGHYHPQDDPPTLVINEENRLFHWLSMGAQPTDSLNRVLKTKGLLEKYAEFKKGTPAAEADDAETDEPVVEEAEAAEVTEAV